MKNSISVIIPCYNEEINIINTVKEVLESVIFLNFDYEIIIIDDGSRDSTFTIVKNNFSKIKNIKIFKNKNNLGLSKTLTLGFSKASYNFLTWVPGDNNHPKDGLIATYEMIGKGYDLIIPSHSNLRDRKYYRYIISKMYTFILNLISKNNISYYNGLVVFNKNLFKKDKFIFFSKFNMSFLAAYLVYMLNKSNNYTEVSVKISEDIHSKSTSLNFKNILVSLYFITCLIFNAKYFK